MPTIEITADYDGSSVYDEQAGAYLKRTTAPHLYVGYDSANKERNRAFIRFLLSSLPANATVTQVRLLCECSYAGGASHQTDIHPYNGDGQANPANDGAGTTYSRCAAGTEYVNNSTALRTFGKKEFNLGSQACTDVENAKSAVNRFSLGLHEEGDNDAYAALYSIDYPNGVQMPTLVITYTFPAPAVGYHYSDGLVCVQVAG